MPTNAWRNNMAQTPYDVEVVGARLWQYHQQLGDIWMVEYRWGDVSGQIPIAALDALDAYRKLPAELERLSKNYEE